MIVWFNAVLLSQLTSYSKLVSSLEKHDIIICDSLRQSSKAGEFVLQKMPPSLSNLIPFESALFLPH